MQNSMRAALVESCAVEDSFDDEVLKFKFNEGVEIMSYLSRDTYGMYKRFGGKTGPGPSLMGAHTLLGDDVSNAAGETLGEIKEIMLDMQTGKVAYAVLSFGGFLGMGEKLFAIPWHALRLDTERHAFVLNASKEQLKAAPGFDKNDWPDMTDPMWIQTVNSYYDVRH